MQVAVKFDKGHFEDEDTELVLFQKQMLIDVYYYERDPMPSLDEWKYQEWITRPNDESFWVYRQGTMIDFHYLEHCYIARAKTSELDANPPTTFEGYSHVKSLNFQETVRFDIERADRSVTLRQIEMHQRMLYGHLTRMMGVKIGG